MSKINSFFRDFLTPIALFAIAGVLIHDHYVGLTPSGPRPIVDGVSLGKVFAPSVSATLGDAWDAAADALEQGKTVSEAQSALQQTWQDGRVKAFTSKVAPEFSRVLTEGAEPTDPSKRAEVVKLWRDFASGLKGGR